MRQFALVLGCLLVVPAVAADRPNLVLVTIDTTRADHLSTYGHDQPTSPHLTALAAQGVRFDRAYTPVHLTGPAHASILTGLYPHRHGAVRNGIRISKTVPTLTELLRARGYKTAAFLSGWTLKKKLCGLDRGFDLYDAKMDRRTRIATSERDGRNTARAVLSWLEDNSEGPFFLWVHFFDPHSPYMRRPGMPVQTGNEKVDAYDNEIRYADNQMGRVLDALDQLGLRDRTLVVATSDHGELLGENGVWGHSFTVAPEVLRVPLVLRFPGRLPEGRVLSEPVSILDLFATMGSLLGLKDLPPHDGIDLSAAAAGYGRLDPERRTWFAAYPGVVRGPFKGLRRVSPVPLKAGYRQGRVRVVWDIKKDEVHTEAVPWPAPATDSRAPIKTVDRTEEAWLAAVRGDVREWLRSRIEQLEDDQLADLTEEDRERLRGLGYLP